MRGHASAVALAIAVSACQCSSPPLRNACEMDEECGPAGACKEGGCVTCTSCGDGTHCLRAQCLPASCGSQLCANDEACIDDACRGAACVGVTCPTGQSCAAGMCYPTTCNGVTCATGTVCDGTRCIGTACAGVSCPSGQVCAGGQCLDTSCGATGCGPGSVCVNAECVDAACVGVLCTSGARCLGGACVGPLTDGGPGDDAGVPDSGVPDAGVLCPNPMLTCSVMGTVFTCGQGATAGACQVCLPDVSTSGFTPLPDGTSCDGGEICAFGNCVGACFIAGAVVPAGTADPTGSCRTCQPNLSTTMYTSIADGTPCASGKVCRTGLCTDGCFISGAYVPPLALNPSGTCQECRPMNDSTAWSNSSDGTACSPGKVCVTGQCSSACFVDGGLFDAGTVDPANPCQLCSPPVSTGGFTNRPDGTSCGASASCNGGNCDCSGGLRYCAPRCVDLATNSANCGGCGQACDGGTACFASSCQRPVAMPTSRAGPAAATVQDGHIYVVGGGTSFGVYGGGSGPASSAFSTVEIYDPATNSWQSGPPLPTARLNLGAALGNDGRIYTFGGWTGNASSNAVEIYDPSTGNWTNGAPMLTSREDPGVTLGPDGKLYATNGGNGVQAYNHLEAYDPVGNSWVSRANALFATGGMGFATGSDGRLYGAGGGFHSGACSASASTYSYVIGTDSWASGPVLITARMLPGVLTGADGRIWVIGGAQGCADTYRAEVEALTPGASSWSSQAPLVQARAAAAVALGHDGRLYVFGGKGVAGDGGVLLNSVEVYDPSVQRWVHSP